MNPRTQPRGRARLLLAAALVSFACGQTPPEPALEIGYARVNDTELYYKRLGAGEPVLVVHGGPLLDHGYFLPHLRPLAEHYELIFFDQRLSGRSSAEVDTAVVRLATFVEDIEALRQALGLGRMHLMAHSWGGLLAMHYAVGYGEHLKSLILLNSMPASAALWQQEEQRLARQVTREDSLARQRILASEAFKNYEPEAIAELLRVSFRTQFHKPALVDRLRLYVPEDYRIRSQRFRPLMGDLMAYDLHPQLSEVTAPTLLLYGAGEPAAALSGPRLQEALPNAKLVIMEKTGHFPFVEQPNAFHREIRGFLEGL